MYVNKRIQMIVRSMLCIYNRHRRILSERGLWVGLFIIGYLVYTWTTSTISSLTGHTATVVDDQGQVHTYNSKSSPLIFIGGHPRSGTTLMRAILDSHPLVRCGEESRIIPRIVSMRDNWNKNEKEKERLLQGGIDKKVIVILTLLIIIFSQICIVVVSR